MSHPISNFNEGQMRHNEIESKVGYRWGQRNERQGWLQKRPIRVTLLSLFILLTLLITQGLFF